MNDKELKASEKCSLLYFQEGCWKQIQDAHFPVHLYSLIEKGHYLELGKVKSYYFYLFCVFICMCTVHARAHQWSQMITPESWFSPSTMRVLEYAQIVKISSKCLHPLSYLTGPQRASKGERQRERDQGGVSTVSKRQSHC